MADGNYTLLFSEILDKVHKAKTKSEKVALLIINDSSALRMVLKASFDPKIEWVIPEGDVPYTKNDAPMGTEHTMLQSEARKLYHFIKGADSDTAQPNKERMFIQMCEGLHETEAQLLCHAKDKKLHQVYKGLSKDVVREAFKWDENFMIEEAPKYPQARGSASGVDA
jgi:hypothetical protein|tara:strand:+ start:74 stop:577 length:504 start_codon:yes stop_codon:yes gene_type:complete